VWLHQKLILRLITSRGSLNRHIEGFK